ncbi:MAG: hypothetical protein SNF93_08205 [Rikenellaceae bacterium]
MRFNSKKYHFKSAVRMPPSRVSSTSSGDPTTRSESSSSTSRATN